MNTSLKPVLNGGAGVNQQGVSPSLSYKPAFAAAAAAALVIAAFGAPLTAQQPVEVATDPVGFVKLSVPANSDATFSVSLNRPEAFSGAINAVTDSDTIQIQGADWANNEFAGKFYVLITSGQRSGLTATITANNANSVDLQFTNDNLGTTENGVKQGDHIKIIPYWTLSTLLPDGIIPNGTRVYFINQNQAGVNISPSNSSVMYQGFGWYSGAINKNDEIIYPDECFQLRNLTGNRIEFSISGVVRMTDFRTKLAAVQEGTTQDIWLNTGSPIPITLGQFLAQQRLGSAAKGDRVYIFNNEVEGYNKSPSISAQYYEGYGWYNGALNFNDQILQPGWGMIYRKAGTNPSLSVIYKPDYVE